MGSRRASAFRSRGGTAFPYFRDETKRRSTHSKPALSLFLSLSQVSNIAMSCILDAARAADAPDFRYSPDRPRASRASSAKDRLPKTGSSSSPSPRTDTHTHTHTHTGRTVCRRGRSAECAAPRGHRRVARGRAVRAPLASRASAGSLKRERRRFLLIFFCVSSPHRRWRVSHSVARSLQVATARARSSSASSSPSSLSSSRAEDHERLPTHDVEDDADCDVDRISPWGNSAF